MPSRRPPACHRRPGRGLLLAASGGAAVLTLLGMVAWGVSAGPAEPPGHRAGMSPSEEVTDAVDATGPTTVDGTTGEPDRYAEPPACDAFSDAMLTRMAGDDPRAGDGEPTSPPNHGDGELTSCAWTGGEEGIVAQIRFFPPGDGSGTEAAKAEMASQNVDEEVSGIGEEALFTMEGPCRLLVRDSNVILTVSIQSQDCNRSFAKAMARDYADRNF